MWGKFITFMRNQKGATAIEYGLIAGAVALAILSVVLLLGGNIDEMFTGIADYLSGAVDDS